MRVKVRGRGDSHSFLLSEQRDKTGAPVQRQVWAKKVPSVSNGFKDTGEVFVEEVTVAEGLGGRAS